MSEESNESRWYVVHTYSGYENKVKANIEKIIENRGLQEYIHDIVVPVQNTIEIKNGQKKTIQRKVFPGYVLLKMIMNDETWYVVRNTRGVTSFVGPGSKPVPLTDDEVVAMGIEALETIDISPEETVRVVSGPFEGSVGIVKDVNLSKRVVIVKLSIFGRETPLEMEFAQIAKL